MNGQQIARRNAPSVTAWNSTAVAARPLAQSSAIESINVSDFLDTLVPGANVLSIQGLSAAADDTNFLIAPELIATTAQDDVRTAKRFFQKEKYTQLLTTFA